jgi:N-acetylglucosamine-6-phosphate deacetylase
MPAFSHRSPGVIGAAFDSDHVHVELICDGVHVDPSVVRATYKMFGEDRIILISDSMMATGLQDGQYSLGGQEVTVIGNKATLADGTIAGSATNLMQCMRTAVSFGIPLETAIKCAAVNPAKEIGIYDRYGSITPGKYANLVLLNQNLELVKVFLKGEMLF